MKIFMPSLILSSLLSSLYAETDISENLRILSLEELMEVTIISATGTEQNIADAPSIATVITAEQIERSSARTLAEVLAMVPGLQTYLTDEGQKVGFDIRGIVGGFNAQILTLINGVSIDKFETGSTMQQFTFPASAIKRVEVIRGPGSAVYGADAFAGVVNIITKDATYLSNNSQAGVRYGSFETAEVYGNYGKVYESGIDMGLNLSYMRSDGDRGRVIDSDTQTELDTIFGTSASLAPDAMNKQYEVFNLNLNLNYENLTMNLWGYFQKANGHGVGASNAIDNTGNVSGTHIMGDFNYLTYSSNDYKWNNKLVLSYREQVSEFVIFPAGASIPIGDDGNAFTSGGGIVTFTDGYIGNPTTQEEKFVVESTVNISKFENQEIRLSLGYEYIDLSVKETLNFGPSVINGTEGTVDGTLTDITGTPYVFLPNIDRKIFFISLQDEYTLSNDWIVTAGIRYDNYSDFGDTINPRVGIVNHTTDTLTTKLLYGRAFRAPSAGDLYYQNNPSILGNKDLSPETIDMIELGLSYRPTTKLYTSINTYWYEASDLITTVSSDLGIQSQNVGLHYPKQSRQLI